jgi:hypothetical protein
MKGFATSFFLTLAVGASGGAVAQQTTARAEIKRGWDDGAKCAAQNAADAMAEMACVQTLKDENRQRMPQEYRYFEIGLQFNAWQHFDGRSMADPGNSSLRANAKSCWTDYVLARRETGLVDGSVIEAVQAGPAIKSRIAKAEQQFGN